MMVDFPLPLAPTMTTRAPGLIDRDISFRAFVFFLLPGYEKLTFLSFRR